MAALDAIEGWPVSAAAAAVIGPSGVLASHGDTKRVFELASVTKTAGGPGGASRHRGGGRRPSTPRPAHPAPRSVTCWRTASGLAMHSDRILAKPGTRRMYSNYGFTVLAETLQQESGIEFGRYLTEAVCEPLAMGATRQDGGAETAGYGPPLRWRIWPHSPVNCCARRPSRRSCTPRR